MSTKARSSAAPGEVTKYQKFTFMRIRRDQIVNMPRNPRTISTGNLKKLRRSVEQGLLGPVYYNTATKHCYAGNQRLAVLDALEGSSAYSLDVAATKLSEAKEKEACIRLNNEALFGDWDLPILAELLKSDDVEIEDTGFEEVQLETLLGDLGEGIFSEAEQSEETRETVDDVEAMAEARADEAEAARGRRQKIRETTKAEHEREDSERVAFVMFPSRKAREDWVEKLGLDRNERYVPAKAVAKVR